MKVFGYWDGHLQRHERLKRLVSADAVRRVPRAESAKRTPYYLMWGHGSIYWQFDATSQAQA